MAVSEEVKRKIKRGEKLEVKEEAPKLTEVVYRRGGNSKKVDIPGEISTESIGAMGNLVPVSHTYLPHTSWDEGKESIYLYGSITRSSGWQNEVIGLLKPYGIQFLNPKHWDVNRINIEVEVMRQLGWENKAFKLCSRVIFWFDHKISNKLEHSIWPNAWYLLGKAINSGKKFYVGCHPNYLRFDDLRVRLKIDAPKMELHNSLRNLILEVVKDLKEEHKF